MKKIICLVWITLFVGIQYNLMFAEAKQINNNISSDSKIIYIPEDEIIESRSLKEKAFTFSKNTKKYASTIELIDFLNDCSTNYGFLQLEKNVEKSSKMKTLYVEILSLLTDVYQNTDEDIELMDFSGEQLYCIGKIPYSTLELSNEEAFEVFMSVLADHPIIYFVEEMIVQDGFHLYIIAAEEFYKGDVRKHYNDSIENAITAFSADTENLKSNYEMVKFVHDSVINQVAYAYEEGTTNPQDNVFVHSIAGYVSDSKQVVCDGYTETIAAILNYLDIETICGFGWGVKQGEVTSETTGHAWNIVKLGNGDYYALDSTWNDTGNENTYNYFCLGKSFYNSHSTIRNDEEDIVSFIYDLPELSVDDFIGEDTILKVEDPVYDAEADIALTGIYNGYSYEMMQDGSIYLTGYTGTDMIIEVPAEIAGHKVVSITNCFNYNDTITEITLPDTINYIGFVGYGCNKLEKLTINTYNPEDVSNSYFSFMNGMFGNCQNLKTIIVNENGNLKTFWVEDNVLYYGNLDDIMLVLYPGGKTDENYNFKYAMKIGSSAFEENKYIKNVVFEEQIKDTTLMDGVAVNPPSHVFYHCTSLESVTLMKGAPTVMSDWFDGCVSLKSFEIPNTVTKLGSMMFNGCSSLKEIVIPQSVTYIENSVFQDCISLESCTIYNDNIIFENAFVDGIEFDGIWNGCREVVLYCNANSNTENYAKRLNIKYAGIGSTEEKPGESTEEKPGGSTEEKPGGSTGGSTGGNTDGSTTEGTNKEPATGVTTQPIKVTSIRISGISIKIAAGKKVRLTANIYPVNATNQKVIWSSNKKYATVDADGTVRIKKTGAGKTVTITAMAADGSGIKDTYRINIMPKAVKKITLKAAKTVKAGKSVAIKANVAPSQKVNKKLVWKSSNPDYATVNQKGVVRTKKAGKGKTVIITAQATDGSGKKKTVRIKIK